jgi:TPR repeat protein
MTQDALLAFGNYRKAADQGHLEAMLTLGHFYEVGRAVQREAEERQNIHSIRRLVLDSLSNCNDKQKLQKVLSTLRNTA